MSKVTGVISKCYHNRERGTYSIILNGSDVWYGCYKTDYSHLEGREVSFEAESKAGKGGKRYWNVVGDVEPVPESARGPAQSQTSAPAMSGDLKQQSIVLQSSFKTAGEVVAAELAAGTLSLGTKKGDQHDKVLDIVKQVAFDIYSCCIDPVTFLSQYESDDPAPVAASDGYDATDA